MRKKKKILIAAAAVIMIAGVLIFSLTVKPNIKLKGDTEATIEVFDTYEEEGASASFIKKDITSSIKTESNLDTGKLGDYQITYTASYHGRTAEMTRTIHVIDKESPVLELSGAVNLTLSSMDCFTEPGFSASDNYDGDLTDAVKVTKKENKENNTGTITYEVHDSSGNQVSAVRNVTIKDIVPPDLSVNGNKKLTLAYGAEYIEQGAFAEDDLDGDISESIVITGTVDTSKPGDQTVTYTAKDAAGNSASVARIIHVLKAGEKNPNAIYLTFDDGPSSKVTPQVLKILKKYNVKATFFILNYDKEDKDILQQMLDDGHTIGIHGYSHDYAEIYKSVDAFMENITKLDKKIQKDFDYEPFVIRFPGGSSNTISRNYSEGIMTKLVKKVANAGYTYLDWNVDSEDATGNNVDKNKLIKNVKNELKENRDNVVLMHDTNNKETTAQALTKIIKYAKKNGYEFYAFSEDTQAVHHGVNN